MTSIVNSLFSTHLSLGNYVRITLTSLVIIFFILMLIAKIIVKIKKKETFLSTSISAIFPAVVLATFILICYSLVNIFFIEIAKHKYFNLSSRIFFVVSIAYIFYRATGILKYLIYNWRDKLGKIHPDDTTIKWITTAIRIVIVIVMFLSILKIFNIKLTALIAGLGIGGIAVALAAQDSLSNVLGFVLIILDKPFSAGERVKILEYDGTIETVGIRSTKIRTLEGAIVVLPNKTIANASIENIAARKTIRNFENIELDASTIRLENLPSFIEKIKIILGSTENITDEYRVFFDNSDGAKVVIKMWYWVDVNDYWVYMERKENINYRICDMFDKAGVLYYMPTNTVYLKKDN